MRKNWWLGFLGLFSIYGGIGLVNGEWIQGAWLLWLIWLGYFWPEKKFEEQAKVNNALERSNNENIGNNNHNNGLRAKGIVRT